MASSLAEQSTPTANPTASSVPGPASSGRKRRAVRACLSCRSRKVRCNVIQQTPCTNCRLDEIECVVLPRNRRGTASATSAPRLDGIEEALFVTTPFPDENIADVSKAAPITSPIDPVFSVEAVLSQEIFHEGIGLPETIGLSEQIQDTVLLPSFIRPLPPHMSADDAEYLGLKGALSVPDSTLLGAFLQGFVEYVYPFMPILDLHEILGAIQNARRPGGVVDEQLGGPPQISLLLLQAILFAAAPFVDMRQLQMAGFPSKKAARQTYFQRTRILYNLDYETDHIILIQSLLLMSYWHDTLDDEKDASHWIGVGVSIADTIDLDALAGPATTSKERLKKRIWWSCYARDRLISLGMRRPTKVDETKYGGSMLEESDFEIRALPATNTVLPASCTLLRDVGRQRELAAIFISKLQLCKYISDVLETQYSIQSTVVRGRPDTTTSAMMMSPNADIDIEAVHNIYETITRWRKSLPVVCQTPDAGGKSLEEAGPVINLHRIYLQMLCQSAIISLFRPMCLPSFRATKAPGQMQDIRALSHTRVIEAATYISDTSFELGQLGLIPCLPSSGITVLFSSMIAHIAELKAHPTGEASEPPMRGLSNCKRVLDYFCEVYNVADAVAFIAQAALRTISLAAGAGGSTPAGPGVLNLQTPMIGAEASRSGVADFGQTSLDSMEAPLPRPSLVDIDKGRAWANKIVGPSLVELVEGPSAHDPLNFDTDPTWQESSLFTGLEGDSSGMYMSGGESPESDIDFALDVDAIDHMIGTD
ncbi:hypothetical protein GQ53DRAFT_823521 [Thozetella sp. PMI_491]|nr:hypothetical protein GQ53DRAFT_823521 [Thozetella sp. PMI_491]